MGLLDNGGGKEANSSGAPERKKSDLGNLLPYTTVALVLAVLYVAWTFYSRQQRAKESEAAIEKAREDDRKKQADLVFGSGEVKFLIFSASPGRVKRGEDSRLCYGVVNAEKLKIEPDIGEDVKPTSRHCAEIKPKATTTYKITGTNAKGQSKDASLTVTVE